MRIHKASARDYATVTAAATVDYIEHYTAQIYNAVTVRNSELRSCNKIQLNVIAAELETVNKRLAWILEGKY